MIAPRRKAGRTGRVLSVIGALMLCVSSFLPMIDFDFRGAPVTSEGVAPVEFVARGGHLAVEFGLPFLAAALLVPVAALRAVPQVDNARSAGKLLAWAQCAICLPVLLYRLREPIYHLAFLISGMALTRIVVVTWRDGIGVLLLVLAIVALVRSTLPRKAAAAQFALWTHLLLLYSAIAVNSDTYFGLWISLVGSALLVIGAAVDWFQCRPARPESAGAEQ